MLRRNFLWMALLLTPALTAAAEPGAVRMAVDRYMPGYVNKITKQLGANSRVEYTIAMPDAQLNQNACTIPLTLNAKDNAQFSARLSLQVSCGESWSIIVPVDLAIFRPVVVATQPLGPGSVIDAGDVQLVDADITQLTGEYVTDLNEVVGMSVKRSLMQGRAVLAPQLVQPLMIRRGEAVTINAQSSVIAVKMSGIALTDGRRGEQIRIKNQGSSRVIDARVTGPGQVQAAM